MTNLHKIVIDNGSKVIGWEAIIFQDDLIIYVFIVELNLSVNYILEMRNALRNLHPNDERLTVGFPLLNLLCRQAFTSSVIFCLAKFLPRNLLPHLSETLSCAKARISISILLKINKKWSGF